MIFVVACSVEEKEGEEESNCKIVRRRGGDCCPWHQQLDWRLLYLSPRPNLRAKRSVSRAWADAPGRSVTGAGLPYEAEYRQGYILGRSVWVLKNFFYNHEYVKIRILTWWERWSGLFCLAAVGYVFFWGRGVRKICLVLPSKSTHRIRLPGAWNLRI